MNFTFQIQKIINRELSVFFLTIAKKNKTRIAYVSEDDRISLSDVILFDYIKCLPLEANITWTAKRESNSCKYFFEACPSIG